VAFSEQIKVLIDIGVKGANELKSLKTQFSDAEGAGAKLGVGMGFLKQHATAALAGAGTAVLTFVGKSIGEFQDLALETDRLATKLGILPEEASRLIEVAGDLGIEMGSVEGAIMKMNKALGASPESFSNLGIEAATAKNGTTDLNETFIRTVERLKAIEDPVERNKAGVKLLGKSWADLSRLLDGDVRSSLAEVSDAKVIDPDEIKKAQAFRDSLDELRGKLEDFALSVGERAVPALVNIIDSIEKVADAAEPVFKFLELGMKNTFSEGAGSTAEVNKQLAELSDRYDEVYGFAKKAETGVSDGTGALDSSTEAMLRMAGVNLSPAADELEDIEDAAEDVKIEVDNFGREWDELKGKLDDEESYNSAVDSLNEIRDAAIEAYGTGMKGTAEEATAAQINLRDATLNGKQAVADYLSEVLKIPASKATWIMALIDGGHLEEAKAEIDRLTKARDVWITPKLTKDNLIVGIDVQGPKTGVRYGATGGIVTKPTLAMIGEAGPEMVVPMNAGPLSSAPGASPLPTGSVGAGGFVWNGDVIVNGSVLTERELIKVVADGLTEAKRRGQILGFQS
jgi:plasmid maintenance system antidote protein VapI